MNRNFITKTETEPCYKDDQHPFDQTHGHQATTWKPMDKTKDGLGCCSGFCACKTEAERDTSQVSVKSNLLRHGISVGFLYVSGAKLQETARDSASVKHRLLFSCNAAQRSRTQQNAAERSRMQQNGYSDCK